MTSFDSPTYPYERIQSGYTRFVGADEIPLKILRYLLDLPDRKGYQPADDNSRPRVRIAKYLWHDGRNPLSERLPDTKEKLSMLFDGEHPDINSHEEKAMHPRGYRIFPQVYWGQTEITAKTVLKCYLGRIIPTSDIQAKIGLCFEILVNANMENTAGTEDAYSRAYAIETALIEALHGVDVAGVGTVRFNRYSHPDDGSYQFHDDGTHVGRSVHMSFEWMESGENCTVVGCNF